MDDLFQTIGDDVGALLRHPVVTLAIQLTIGYLVVMWLVAAYWTFRDLRHRTRDPVLPYIGAGGVLIMTPLAFPLALLAYRIVRPPATVSDQRTRDLEGFVMTAEVAGQTCAGCGRPVDDQWMRCPECANQLATPCSSCGGRIEPDWSVCAWCARDLEPFGEPAVDITPLPMPVVAIAIEPDPDPEPRGAIPGWQLDPDREPKRELAGMPRR